MRFIGRQTELSRLNIEYAHNSSFVVIYGRRRVGKTTLIKEFLKDKTAFYSYSHFPKPKIVADIWLTVCFGQLNDN